MKFTEFLDQHSKLWPAVNFAPGSNGWIDVARLWNGLAMLNKQCEHFIVWESRDSMRFIPNTVEGYKLYLEAIDPKNKNKAKASKEQVNAAKKAIEDRKKNKGANTDKTIELGKAVDNAVKVINGKENIPADGKDRTVDPTGKVAVDDEGKDSDGDHVPSHAKSMAKTKIASK